LSAIMSTASGTLLAPSAILAKNILRPWLNLNDHQLLVTSRICVFGFGLVVLLYAYLSASVGLSIFEMVENAYLVTLCGAFVPLAFGVYWKKASNTGALLSIGFGVLTWAGFEVLSLQMAARDQEIMIPPQLIGLGMAIFGMLIGSYVSQYKDKQAL
jgi:SSS family solute:Na+ symporter